MNSTQYIDIEALGPFSRCYTNTTRPRRAAGKLEIVRKRRPMYFGAAILDSRCIRKDGKLLYNLANVGHSPEQVFLRTAATPVELCARDNRDQRVYSKCLTTERGCQRQHASSILLEYKIYPVGPPCFRSRSHTPPHKPHPCVGTPRTRGQSIQINYLERPLVWSMPPGPTKVSRGAHLNRFTSSMLGSIPDCM